MSEWTTVNVGTACMERNFLLRITQRYSNASLPSSGFLFMRRRDLEPLPFPTLLTKPPDAICMAINTAVVDTGVHLNYAGYHR